MSIAEELIEWALIAFYPGPNESKEFQSGYMTAVHDIKRVVQRYIDRKQEEK